MNLRAAGIRRSLMRDRAISATQLGREWAGALLMTPALPESLRAPARNASHKGNAVLVSRCAWAEARRPSFVRSQMRPVHEDPVPPVTTNTSLGTRWRWRRRDRRSTRPSRAGESVQLATGPRCTVQSGTGPPKEPRPSCQRAERRQQGALFGFLF